MAESKTPLHIITGFLGAGKTTAILNILQMLPDGERAAVVVNERGEVSLDGPVMAESRPGLDIREVSGGCICCTAGAAMDKALNELLDLVKPDRLLVEPSGVAKSGDLTDMIWGSKVGLRLEMRPIIGLVDPKRFLNKQIMNMPLYRDQVETADILVANRCDLADELEIAEFEKRAGELFPPKAAVLTTTYGRLEPWVLEPLDPAARPARPPRGLDLSPMPTGHQLFEELGLVWGPGTVFSLSRLGERMEQWARLAEPGGRGGIERFKGIFHTDEGWRLLEIAAGRAEMRDTQYRKDSRCQFVLTDQEAGERLDLTGALESTIVGRDPGGLPDRAT